MRPESLVLKLFDVAYNHRLQAVQRTTAAIDPLTRLTILCLGLYSDVACNRKIYQTFVQQTP